MAGVNEKGRRSGTGRWKLPLRGRGRSWWLSPLVVLLGLAGSSLPTLSSGQESLPAAVEAAFKGAVRLWADERFEALWEQGLLRSRYLFPKEAFISKMRDRAVKPACCWRQVQEVTVHLPSSGEALVEAKMGFDSRTRGTSFDQTLTFYLRWEEGTWRVALEDFLFKPDETLHRIFLHPRSKKGLILEPEERIIILKPKGPPLPLRQPWE